MTGQGGWLEWVFKIVNFAVLVGLLVKFAGKPLKDYLQKRSQAVKDKLEELTRKLKEAEALKAEYEQKLARLDGEIEAYRKSMVDEAEKVKKKVIDEAEAMARRIKEQAQLMAAQETKDIQNRIKGEIARLTMERAETILKETTKKSDHDKMVEDFIENLRSMN
jgi:F-type H+-transporting ATPase subunit b